ncbi:hypothetical protein BT96DRAFT_1010387, partial [Gymnopus androsaceus JB14]
MAPKGRAAPKVSSSKAASKAASKSTKASKKSKKPQVVELSSDDDDDDDDNAITRPKTKRRHQKRRSSASSDAEVDEEQPRKKKKQRKEVDEPSEDLSWMDRQETSPPQERAEDEPEEGTLAWYEWNLPRAQRKWKSVVYKHFDQVTAEFDKDKDTFYYVFRCKHNHSKSCKRSVNDSTTSNLNTHVKICDSKHGESLTQLTINEQIPRKYNKGEFRLKLVEWVTRRHRPDKIVEDDELIEVFTYLNPTAKPPSRRTLRRDIGT